MNILKARMTAVITISMTEIAAMAGSMLSRRPIHISRGRVMALTLVMNSVTPISSHDSTKDSSAAVAMPNLMLGMMILKARVARCGAEAARGKVDATVDLIERDKDEHHCKGRDHHRMGKRHAQPGVVADPAVETR